jgi:hypothetical protein
MPCLRMHRAKAPNTCAHSHQAAPRISGSTLGCRYHPPVLSVAPCNVLWLAGPVPPSPYALCGPYSSIYAGVVPRTPLTHCLSGSYRPPDTQLPLSLTVTAAQTQPPITTRRNFCMCVKSIGYYRSASCVIRLLWTH